MNPVVKDILKACEREQVVLQVQNGDLEVSYDNVISDDLLKLLKENKKEIVEILSDSTSSLDQIHLDPIPCHPPETGARVLSYAQQRLWFIHELEEQAAMYNMSGAFSLDGKVNREAFTRAMQQVVARHEVLRTKIVAEDGLPHQIIDEEASLEIGYTDLSDEPSTERDNQVARWVREDARRAFDLTESLKLRVHLLRLEQQRHVVAFNLHHIAGDGWSMGLLVREFSALYNAYVRGDDNPLAPLTVQYADYASWQRDWLQGEVLEQQRTYWTEQLQDLPPVHSLPLDTSRPAVQHFEGGVEELWVSKSQLALIQALCRKYDVTMFMFVQTLLSILLSRYSNETDIVMGTPIAGRSHQDTERLIGLFVNSLVLRTDVSDRPTFDALLARNKSMILDAYAHQHMPFEMLVETLQPERSLAYSPLFQILLVMQEDQGNSVDLEDLRLASWGNAEGLSKFDLELGVVESDSGLQMRWRYNRALFAAPTMARMSESFGMMLACVLEEPTRSVFDLPVLAPSERALMLEDWNATQASYPTEDCVHALIEAQVERTPKAVAVTFENQTLSYAQFNKRANGVAHALISKGVEPDTLVGLFAERSLEMVVGILGILKAGAAYVPLDPVYPESRLQYMLEDSAAQIVLTQEHLVSQVSALGVAEPLSLEGLDDKSANTSNPAVANLNSSHLAYVIYTSGSTGQPKGVCTEHRALVNRLDWMQKQYGLDATDRVLQKTPYSFDVSVWEFLWPLITGSSLVMARPGGHREPEYLSKVIQSEGITTLHYVPSMLSAMLENTDWSNCTSVRQLFCSGEALSPELVRRFVGTGTATALHNLYGPTEAAIDVSAWACDATVDHAVIPIGRPIQNIQLYPLGRNQEVVPIGVAGELHIGGAGLARGYLNKPELTAEKFITDPFSADPQARLYRTGDLARWLPDGNLEYLGRIDTQVKIRGYRIELGEIESVLGEVPGVLEAVVLARTDEGREPRLVAYVVTQDGAKNTNAESDPGTETVTDTDARSDRIADWKQHLQTRLPSYMVPELYVELESLPLTSNGKVNRRALPAPDEGDLNRLEYVAPSTEVQATLCELWQQVLKVERVGINDNFFALGGHSLMATRLISLVRGALSVEVPLRTLFEWPTVKGFAAQLSSLSEDTVLPDIERVERDTPLALSYAQQRLWFIQELEEQAALYNMPGAFALDGEFNRDAFTRAMQRVVARHEVLRTKIVAKDGQPRQIIDEEASLEIGFTDLSDDASKGRGDKGRDDKERNDEVARWVREDALCAFDLTQSLKLRVHLLRLEEQRHVVVFNLHHIAGDGWSMGLLVREFSALYNAYVRGDEDPLTPLTVQYADFASWQRGWLQGEVLEQQRTYWTEQLQGLPPVHSLPLDKPRPPVQGFHSASVGSTIEASLLDEIRRFCDQYNVTLFIFLQSAFAVALARLSGSSNILMTTAIAGRRHESLHPLIGNFVNDLVLHADIDDSLPFDEFIANNKSTILNAYANQDFPFEMLVETLRPRRDLSHAAIAQIKFDLQNNEQTSFSMEGVGVNPLRRNSQFTDKDLYLNVVDFTDRLAINWQYSCEIFNEDTIARWSDCYASVLREIVAHPNKRIAEFKVATDDQISAAKSLGVGEVDERLAASPVYEQIEQQASRNPEAVAVEFEGDSITFGELNAEANQLAHYLVGVEVVPGDRIAIFAERSIDMVVGLLATMKIGATYVPLDISSPQERLDFMLRDSACCAILGHSHLLSELPVEKQKVFPLDGDMRRQLLNSYSEENLLERGAKNPQQHPAYLIFTSGSTGKPKGVMVGHDSLANYVGHVLSHYVTPQVSSFVVSTPLAFDATVTTLWASLCAGIRQIILPEESAIEELGQYLFDHPEPLLFKLTPAHLEAVLAGRDSSATSEAAHTLVIGGEQLTTLTLGPLAEKVSARTRFINEYGPTEATVGCSVYVVTAEDVQKGAVGGGYAVPIGRAIANTRLYVLDRLGNVQPIGVPGELHIGGAGLAQGYLNRPELTAEKFITDPFSADSSSTDSQARLYRTGDLVRWLPDGNLEFLGRIDTQVKIRGYRIELGEIESVLGEAPDVREAVVLARTDEGHEPRLVAYVVPEGGIKDTDADAAGRSDRIGHWKQHLQTRLPGYMVPELYVELESLPLTSNGKVNRRALPEPEEGDLNRLEYVAPRSEVEETLCELWREVLKVEQVGIDDNFFDLGGHSLIATRLISLVRASLSIEVPVRTLFEWPTVKGFAAQLSSLSEDTVLPNIERVERGAPLALSHAQQRLWFIQELEEQAALYNIPGAFALDGELNREAFTRAMQRMVARHEVLRTKIVTKNGQPHQIIDEEASLEIGYTDLSGEASKERDDQVARLISKDARRAFDLTESLKLRVHLLRLDEQRHVVVFNVHHIAGDGWSMGLLVEEFSTLYNVYARGEDDPLAPLTVQYADYASWQRDWLQGEVLEKQKTYWTEQLQDLPPVHSLLLDTPRPAVQHFEGGVEELWVSKTQLALIQALCRKHDVTMFMFVQTLLSVLLSRYSNETDVVMGTPIAGRSHQDTERLIGLFVNSLVLRTDVSDGPTFDALLARNKGMILDAYAHQHMPFEMLVETLQPERSLAYSPLFQILLVMQEAAGDGVDLEGLRLAPWGNAEVLSKFDLELNVVEGDSELQMRWRYNRALFTASTIARMSESFGMLLAGVLEEPTRSVFDLPVLPKGERALMLEDWNATQASYPTEDCVHALIEAQVALTPEAVAVTFDNQTLNYAQLNERANGVAHALISKGVEPDTLVGLFAERSLEMVVGILGILKAGAAYVPLDPEYPKSRLQYMLKDSAAQVVLTQKHLLYQVSALGVTEPLSLENLADGSADTTNPVITNLNSSHLAYVIYTSGSTGQPKGVCTEHRAIVNRLDWMQKQYGLDATDRVLQKTPFSFDVSVWEFLWPLITGSSLVMARPAGHRAPEYLSNLIQSEGITTLHYVPSMLSAMLESTDWSSCTSVRQLFCSGEALAPELVRRFVATGTATALHNLYGPTEAAIDVSAWACDATVDHAVIPIGQPIQNIQLYPLGRNQEVVPIGVAGELHIGGAGLAAGLSEQA